MSTEIKGLSEEKLDISHIGEFRILLENLQEDASEYCFSNLFLFRHRHDYRILRSGGFTFLQGVTYDGQHFLMPFNKLAEIGEPLLNNLMKEGYCLYPVAKDDLNIFSDDKYSVSFNEDDSDYIYTVERMKNLPGRHLHKKRNLIKQYRNLYKYEDKDYECDCRIDVVKVIDGWFERTGLSKDETDYDACIEAVNLCEIFGWVGQVYYADGQPSGVLFGEKLNDKMFAVHFAKGITDFKGIYPHMYSSLASKLDPEYTLLNFEQDLGKENLRQAKSSYMQDYMIDKYRVFLK